MPQMSEFVFLYPIQPYIDDVLGDKDTRPDFKFQLCPRLNEIVNRRYRNRDYDVSWVMFGCSGDETTPDMSTKAQEIDIYPNDKIISAGISFVRHRDEKVYPDNAYLLEQIANPKKLVIGGFHQWDCVNRLAESAYLGGLDVFVDENTTDVYFLSGYGYRKIPLVKDIPYTIPGKSLGGLDDIARENRKDMPWFPKIV